MVLQPEDHVAFAGHGQHALDAADRPLEPLFAADAGMALAAQDAADHARAAEPARDADQFRFAIDRTLAGVGVGMGEVGRAAEHRHHEAGGVDGFADRIEIPRFEAGEEPVEHLEAVGVELLRHLDPVEDRHRPLAGDLVEVALREGGELQGH